MQGSHGSTGRYWYWYGRWFRHGCRFTLGRIYPSDWMGRWRHTGCHWFHSVYTYSWWCWYTWCSFLANAITWLIIWRFLAWILTSSLAGHVTRSRRNVTKFTLYAIGWTLLPADFSNARAPDTRLAKLSRIAEPVLAYVTRLLAF